MPSQTLALYRNHFPDDTRSDDEITLDLADDNGFLESDPSLKADYLRLQNKYNPLSTGDYAKHAVGQAAQGAVSFLAAEPLKQVAVLSDLADRKLVDLTPGDPEIKDRTSYRLGQWMQDATEAILPTSTDPRLTGSFLASDVPQVIGQVGGLIVGGGLVKGTVGGLAKLAGVKTAEAAARAGMASAKTVTMLQMYGAEAQGAWEREIARQEAAGEPLDLDKGAGKGVLYGLIAGAIESKLGAGRFLEKYGITNPQAIDTAKKWAKMSNPQLVGEIGKDIAANFTEESLQRIAEDMIVDGHLTPNAILREGLAGAVAGGLIGAIGNPIKRRSAKAAANAEGVADLPAATDSVPLMGEDGKPLVVTETTAAPPANYAPVPTPDERRQFEDLAKRDLLGDIAAQSTARGLTPEQQLQYNAIKNELRATKKEVIPSETEKEKEGELQVEPPVASVPPPTTAITPAPVSVGATGANSQGAASSTEVVITPERLDAIALKVANPDAPALSEEENAILNRITPEQRTAYLAKVKLAKARIRATQEPTPTPVKPVPVPVVVPPAAPPVSDAEVVAALEADAKAKVEKAAAKTDVTPTPAEKKSGDYTKGRVTIDGLTIDIENPKGSQRTGTDAGGKPWSVTMPVHYGEIVRTRQNDNPEGKDGDPIDVFIGDNPASDQVFVIDQINPETRRFDETKVLTGFNSEAEAVAAYDGSFSDGSGPSRRRTITPTTKAGLKEWLAKADTTKVFNGNLPEHNVVVQKLGRADGKGDYVQIDFVKNGGSVRSTNPEELRREGYEVPDYSTLPQGNYTGAKAAELLAAPAVPVVTTPASTPVVATPDSKTAEEILGMVDTEGVSAPLMQGKAGVGVQSQPAIVEGNPVEVGSKLFLDSRADAKDKSLSRKLAVLLDPDGKTVHLGTVWENDGRKVQLAGKTGTKLNALEGFTLLAALKTKEPTKGFHRTMTLDAWHQTAAVIRSQLNSAKTTATASEAKMQEGGFDAEGNRIEGQNEATVEVDEAEQMRQNANEFFALLKGKMTDKNGKLRELTNKDLKRIATELLADKENADAVRPALAAAMKGLIAEDPTIQDLPISEQLNLLADRVAASVTAIYEQAKSRVSQASAAQPQLPTVGTPSDRQIETGTPESQAANEGRPAVAPASPEAASGGAAEARDYSIGLSQGAKVSIPSGSHTLSMFPEVERVGYLTGRTKTLAGTEFTEVEFRNLPEGNPTRREFIATAFIEPSYSLGNLKQPSYFGANISGITVAEAQPIASLIEGAYGLPVTVVNDPTWTHTNKDGETAIIRGEAKRDGTIVLNAAGVTSADELLMVGLHEAVGHAGVRGVMGAEFDQFMLELYKTLTPAQKAQADDIAGRYGYNTNFMSGIINTMSELAAHQAERLDTERSVYRKVLDWIQANILKHFGFKAGEAEVRRLLQRSHDFLTTPKPVHDSIRYNQFKGAREMIENGQLVREPIVQNTLEAVAYALLPAGENIRNEIPRTVSGEKPLVVLGYPAEQRLKDAGLETIKFRPPTSNLDLVVGFKHENKANAEQLVEAYRRGDVPQIERLLGYTPSKADYSLAPASGPIRANPTLEIEMSAALNNHQRSLENAVLKALGKDADIKEVRGLLGLKDSDKAGELIAKSAEAQGATFNADKEIGGKQGFQSDAAKGEALRRVAIQTQDALLTMGEKQRKVGLQLEELLKQQKAEGTSEVIEKRIDKVSSALAVLDKGVAEWTKGLEKIGAQLGVAPHFVLADGAVMLNPLSPDAKSKDVLESQETISMKAGQVTKPEVLDRILENQREFLKAREAVSDKPDSEEYQKARDMTYQTVRRQFLEAVKFRHYDAQYQRTGWNRFQLALGEVGKFFEAFGVTSGRQSSQMLNRAGGMMLANRAEGIRVAVAVENAQRSALGILNRGRKDIQVTTKEYLDKIVRPVEFYFGDNGLDLAEQYHGDKEGLDRQLKRLAERILLQNGALKPLIADRQAEFMAAFWKDMKAREASHIFRFNLSQQGKAGVRDERIRVRNPITGNLEEAIRNPIPPGVLSMSRTVGPLSEWVSLLRPQWEKADWKGIAEAYKEGDSEALENMLGPLMDDTALREFLGPLMNTQGASKFLAPEQEGVPRQTAPPDAVAKAWRASGGDLVKFLETLHDDLGGKDREAFVLGGLKQVRDFWHFARNLQDVADPESTAKGEFLPVRGMVPPAMIESRQLTGWPAEWFGVHSHDTIDTLRTIERITANNAFSRDAGTLAASLDQLRADVNLGLARLNDARRAVGQQMGLKPAAIEAALKQKLGPDEYAKLLRWERLAPSLHGKVKQLVEFYRHSNHPDYQLGFAQRLIGSLAKLMVNNPATAIFTTTAMFDLPIRYGAGQSSLFAVANTIKATAREAGMSFLQQFGLQIQSDNEFRDMALRWGAKDAEVFRVRDALLRQVEERNTTSYGLRAGSELLGSGFNPEVNGKRGTAAVLRPLAPFQSMQKWIDLGITEGLVRHVVGTIDKAAKFYKGNVKAFNDRAHRITAKEIGMDEAGFKALSEDFAHAGLSLDEMARRKVSEGRGITDEEGQLLYGSIAMSKISLQGNVGNTPLWAYNNQLARVALPLLRWTMLKTAQIGGGIQDNEGRLSLSAAQKTTAGLAIASLGALAVSGVVDLYDEWLLGKKRNVRTNPLARIANEGFENPGELLKASIERLSRVGTFGFFGELANTALNHKDSPDNRTFSLDQRLVFMNSMNSLFRAGNAIVNMGDVDYAHVVRPAMSGLGLSSLLQFEQTISRALGLDNEESRYINRLNAKNYLLVAGRENKLDVIRGGGAYGAPTPVTPWLSRMETAAYANDAADFRDAYRGALLAAKENGHAGDAESYVQRAFTYRNPLKAAFKTPPTEREYRKLLAAMPDDGRRDVVQALNLFNRYAEKIGAKAFEGKVERQTTTTASTSSLFGGGRTERISLFDARSRATDGESLFR